MKHEWVVGKFGGRCRICNRKRYRNYNNPACKGTVTGRTPITTDPNVQNITPPGVDRELVNKVRWAFGYSYPERDPVRV